MSCRTTQIRERLSLSFPSINQNYLPKHKLFLQELSSKIYCNMLQNTAASWSIEGMHLINWIIFEINFAQNYLAQMVMQNISCKIISRNYLQYNCIIMNYWRCPSGPLHNNPLSNYLGNSSWTTKLPKYLWKFMFFV